MLDYSINEPQGILILKPEGPLSKRDFDGLSAAVDSYLATHEVLKGVLIRAKGFPGSENFSGFTAHMHFVREHCLAAPSEPSRASWWIARGTAKRLE